MKVLTAFLFRLYYYLIIKVSSEPVHLQYSAFCQNLDYFEQQRYFPIDVPEHHLPWIWESVYDPIMNLVDLTTMSRIPCRFNKAQWKLLQTLFPEHLHQLGYGLESNILVPVDDNITIAEEYYLISTHVNCEFMHNDQSVSITKSKRIRGKLPYVSLSTLQIRCPAPSSDIIWDSIRIRINPNRVEHVNDVFSNVTVAVPVCRLPIYKPKEKQYRLSICTATGRSNRKHLVEWIEYHRLMGVDHFFLYDTSLFDRQLLTETLYDYINEKVVTVIPWHFMNCVRYMACGRWNVYRLPGQTEPSFFQSPKAIAQQAGLASCYSRFRHTSKYIIHVDDDEFLTFSQSKMKSTLRTSVELTSLTDLADAVFDKNPRATAIRFEPIQFWPCNQTNGIEHTTYNAIDNPENIKALKYRSTPLPRIGTWDIAELHESPYECKLIMRTDAVGMFFVHFVSLVEHGPWERARKTTELTYPITHVSMLHYKYPSSLEKNILDGSLPYTNTSFHDDCKYWKRFRHAGKYFHAQISFEIAEQLKQRYRSRMLA